MTLLIILIMLKGAFMMEAKSLIVTLILIILINIMQVAYT